VGKGGEKGRREKEGMGRERAREKGYERNRIVKDREKSLITL
jgi:hypothetical protein